MTGFTATCLRTLCLTAVLLLAAAAAAEAGSAWRTEVSDVRAPAPHQVISRSRPLKQAVTEIVNMKSGPFPYDGKLPGSEVPFLDVASETGRRGHTGLGGRVYWADETFNDNRTLFHIPANFDIRRPAVIVVFLHGHGATLDRDVHLRQKLPEQISQSGVNAVLVAPQLAVDAADSSAGRFWQTGGFAKFMGEAAQSLGKLHGGKNAVRAFTSMPVIIVSYSGGFQAAAYAIEKGGLKRRVRGLVLMDSLYGELDRFTAWLKSDPGAFLVSTYLGSTQDHNAEFARRLTAASISYGTELPPVLKPGSITIMPAGTDITHRDLMTTAWTASPVADLLRRLREYRH